MQATLTFRQERFICEYLKDQNASAAAARAGYQAKNMAAQGHELLNNPDIRDRIRMEMNDILAEIRCSAVDLLKQRRKIAFFDPRKLFSADGTPLLPAQMDEETRAVVEASTVTRKSGPVVRVKHPDRCRALRALERFHERLEKLDEAYYAALEKKRQVPTLEEIEALDADEAPAENIEKCRVLSGGGDMEHASKQEKTMVLSGSATVPMGTRPSPKGTSFGASTSSGRTADICGIPQKPRVLSGSRLRGVPRMSPLMAALVRGVAQAA